MREIAPQGGSGRTAGRSHEPQDLRIKLVVLFGVALTATLIGSHFLLRAVFSDYAAWVDRHDRPRPPLRAARVLPPEPRLQENPGEDLERLRREETRRLETYGWIDRDKKVLRMPIERAIDQVLRRGVPARTPARSAD
jgi:hypothetical protein